MDFYKKIFRSKKLRFKILSLFKFIPDEEMLKWQYRIKSGRKLDITNPQRYTEKLQWYKLYYRNEMMSRCADKYIVREYVEEKGLGGILNDLYAVFERPEDIKFDALPGEFVLKLSNGSSTNLVCKDKTEYNINEVRKQFEDFLAQSSSSAGREWVYRNKPVIIAEKLLKDNTQENGALVDYKILCFNGAPEYIICVGGRYTDSYHHVVYDTAWNKLDVKIGTSSNKKDYEKPGELEEMLRIAKVLSEEFPAARVDLYAIQGKIYFGEITFFPWSGYMKFTPDSFDFEMGEKFVLPERNN